MAEDKKEETPPVEAQESKTTEPVLVEKPVDVKTEEKPEIVVKEVTPDELFKPLAKNMPEPTGPLPDLKDDFPPDPNLPPPVENKDAIKDRVGNVFDSTKYKVDDKGAPRLDKRGVFIPIDKGRKPGTTKDKQENVFAAQNNTGLPDEYDAAATMYFDMSTGMLSGVISEEWNPESDAERQGMIKAVAAYLRAKGSIEITPGQALLFVSIGYVGKRLNKPKTKEKLTLWFLKLKGMFKKPQPQLEESK